MGRAVITLADMESGEIGMVIDFGGEFDINSDAHQHANLLLKAMDKFAELRLVRHDAGEPEHLLADAISETVAEIQQDSAQKG